MCDQGHEIIFRSPECVVKEMDIGEAIIKAIRTMNNVYVLEGDNENYYFRKIEEIWMWHKRLGNLSFNHLVKLRNKGVVRMICVIPSSHI